MEPKRRGMSGPGWSRRAMLGAALTAPFAAPATAQPYPSRNPRLIVPFAAGGPADILARIAAEQVSARLGQQIIVDSRPGAGGNLAGEMAARGEADGYTLLVAGQSILAINKALYRTLSYDPATDFAFVAMLGVIANVLIVNPQTVPGRFGCRAGRARQEEARRDLLWFERAGLADPPHHGNHGA